jgi:hypothetical protein
MNKSTVTLFFVFLFIVLGGIVLWWFFIDWAKDTSDSGKQWAQTGKDYGQSTNASGCLDRVLILNERCDGITCGIHNRIFLTSCLKYSLPEPEFCTDVPSSYSILEAAAWEVDQCDAIDRQNQTCHHLFRAVHTFCTNANSN